MERLLVTGVDTLLGSNLALALADRCEVLGLYERLAIASPAAATSPWHPDDRQALAEHVERWQPQWMIHCGPLAATSWDEPPCPVAAEREASRARHLAEVAETYGLRLTVLTSDAVFAGPRMFHDETSPATGLAPLAAHVRSLERTLEGRDVLVARTHAYGWSPDADAPGYAERMFDALATQTPLVVDGRRHATPILATDLAELLWRAYASRLRGVFHMAGAERTSLHRFALELAATMDVEFRPRLTDVGPADALQDETSLSSKRARRALSTATPMLREGLARFVTQGRTGWRQAWQLQAPASAHVIAA